MVRWLKSLPVQCDATVVAVAGAPDGRVMSTSAVAISGERALGGGGQDTIVTERTSSTATGIIDSVKSAVSERAAEDVWSYASEGGKMTRFKKKFLRKITTVKDTSLSEKDNCRGDGRNAEVALNQQRSQVLFVLSRKKKKRELTKKERAILLYLPKGQATCRVDC